MVANIVVSDISVLARTSKLLEEKRKHSTPGQGVFYGEGLDQNLANLARNKRQLGFHADELGVKYIQAISNSPAAILRSDLMFSPELTMCISNRIPQVYRLFNTIIQRNGKPEVDELVELCKETIYR